LFAFRVGDGRKFDDFGEVFAEWFRHISMPFSNWWMKVESWLCMGS
jgi:hypothetical protein